VRAGGCCVLTLQPLHMCCVCVKLGPLD
jgi:hypothetical protein